VPVKVRLNCSMCGIVEYTTNSLPHALTQDDITCPFCKNVCEEVMGIIAIPVEMQPTVIEPKRPEKKATKIRSKYQGDEENGREI